MKFPILILIFINLVGCSKIDFTENLKRDDAEMQKENLIENNFEWDAKQTLDIYNGFTAGSDKTKITAKANKGHLGATMVLLMLQQDEDMRNNNPVDRNINEYYHFGLKGQPLAATYAAANIDDVKDLSSLNNLHEIIKIQKNLIEIGVKGGVLANLPFYLSLVLLQEDEETKLDNDWNIKKKNISNLTKKDWNRIINMSKFLSNKGYEISPIYLMQIYYYGYGNNKDVVRACAWARNAKSDLLDHELLKLKSKIDSEKMSSEQMKECDLLSEKINNELKNNYEDWLQNHSIVYKDEAQNILDEYHIQF